MREFRQHLAEIFGVDRFIRGLDFAQRPPSS